jgi:osmotically-inducible protein OsmY
MSQKTDERITQDAREELTGTPAVTLADPNGSPDAGRVLLTGTAQTSRTTWQAQEAASHLGAVSSVEQEIVVDPAALGLRPDKAIAADMRSALALDYNLPADRIAVRVVDGYVTLTGTVDWDD